MCNKLQAHPYVWAYSGRGVGAYTSEIPVTKNPAPVQCTSTSTVCTRPPILCTSISSVCTQTPYPVYKYLFCVYTDPLSCVQVPLLCVHRPPVLSTGTSTGVHNHIPPVQCTSSSTVCTQTPCPVYRYLYWCTQSHTPCSVYKFLYCVYTDPLSCVQVPLMVYTTPCSVYKHLYFCTHTTYSVY